MRVLCVVLAIVMGASVAHAKRMACVPPLAPPEGKAQTWTDPGRPATPVIENVSIEGNQVFIRAQFSENTELVEITISDAEAKRTELWTTPHRLFLCSPDISIAPGTALISVTALDASRNANSAVTSTVAIAAHHRFRCGTGMIGVLVLAPIALLGIGIGLLVVYFLRRRRLRLPGEPISPLVAEAIARSVLRRNLVALATGVSAIVGFHAADWYGTAVLVAIVPLTALSRVLASHAILRAIDRGERAELHDTLLAVDDRALPTSNRVISAARQHAVPTSIARGAT